VRPHAQAARPLTLRQTRVRPEWRTDRLRRHGWQVIEWSSVVCQTQAR
jgi:hypothetical protein